ncbi:MAG: twin-arginine translocation signal domain-containing protein [Methylocapsa sp.]|nr:twin-arginine translocation signal domain-containing protein [Methylocapsa sp.]
MCEVVRGFLRRVGIGGFGGGTFNGLSGPWPFASRA